MAGEHLLLREGQAGRLMVQRAGYSEPCCNPSQTTGNKKPCEAESDGNWWGKGLGGLRSDISEKLAGHGRALEALKPEPCMLPATAAVSTKDLG